MRPIRRYAPSVSHPPRYSSSFVGRDDELARARSALDDGRAVVTLRGPGGVGKTRVAVELARSVAAAGRTAVFCDLATANTPSDVGATVRRALGAGPDRRPDALARAVETLGPSPLVVLDNCEHVRDAVEGVCRVLLGAGAPVLATSRSPLDAPREVRIAIEPFALPALDASRDALAAHSAVRLLLDRVRAVTGREHASDEDVTLAARIVRRVSGLPLALELAAGRLVTYSLAELDARLSRTPTAVLRSLTGGIAERHRTLEAAVEGSWRLLAARDRAALAQASVFAGPFAQLDADAVLDLGPDASSQDALAALAHAGLLRVHDAATPRFELYQSVRLFAEQRRATTEPDAEQAVARHAALYAHRGEAIASRRGDGVTELEACHDELVRVLEACEARGQRDAARTAHGVALGLAALYAARGCDAARTDVLDRAIAVARRVADESVVPTLAAALRSGAREAAATDGWAIDHDGLWFRAPGCGEVSVRHRLMLARLLAVLAHKRATRPGEAMSRTELIAHVWSGARLVGDSGGNRLRVAVATLRKMGLESLLLHRRDGYLLDGGAVVQVVSAPSAAA